MGGYVLYDRAGDGHLSTLKMGVSAAYGLFLKDSDQQLLSFGVYLGYMRRSVDLSALYFF